MGEALRQPFKNNKMAYYRPDGTPTTPMREIALAVGTFGLWTGLCLIMEVWALYKGRDNKQKTLP